MIEIKEYSGHIRNHKALCNELGIKAGLSRSEREAEIIVKGYEKWGCELPCHIYGMFAFVLYDTKGTLLYAKGVQPLREDQIATAETMQTAEAILTTFGDSHFDIGSGMHNYGYFTERGELFLIGNLSGQSHCRRIPV